MSIVDAIAQWNKEKQKQLIQSYEGEGLRASGKWASELEGSTTQSGNRISSVILGAQYTGALIGGRSSTRSKGSGTITLRQAIRQWIDDKGITPRDKISKDSLAFLIARKIHREGIKVPNRYNSGQLVNRVFGGDVQAELTKMVGEGMLTEMQTSVMSALKK